MTSGENPMTLHVLCGHCHTLFACDVPEPPAGSPPPLPTDRTVLTVACTHCGTPMPLRIRTTDIVEALAVRSSGVA
jgi:hypothetical protein